MIELTIAFGVDEIGFSIGFFLLSALMLSLSSIKFLSLLLPKIEIILQPHSAALQLIVTYLLYYCTNLQSEFFLAKACYRSYNPNPKVMQQ
jgi:hypothetical protein